VIYFALENSFSWMMKYKEMVWWRSGQCFVPQYHSVLNKDGVSSGVIALSEPKRQGWNPVSVSSVLMHFYKALYFVKVLWCHSWDQYQSEPDR